MRRLVFGVILIGGLTLGTAWGQLGTNGAPSGTLKGPGSLSLRLETTPPSEVWVDDDFNDSTNGWGYNRFATIEDGINAVVAGGIVNVAAGVYHERLSITKSLELRGAQFGVDPTLMGARSEPAAESIVDLVDKGVANPNVLIDIPTEVTNVTIAGFTLCGSDTFHYSDECAVRVWDDHVTLEDNVISGFYGVIVKGGDYDVVRRNRITTNKTGVVVQPGPATNLTISANRFLLGTTPDSDAQAIYLTSVTNGDVDGNIAHNFPSNGLGGSHLTRITVSGNDFSGNGKGVSIWGASTYITIDGNILSNAQYGIDIKGQHITILNNTINGCGVAGVRVAKHELETEDVTLRRNDLSGNTTHGLLVDSLVSATVDAKQNYWGTMIGSGVAAQISGDVDFDPWCNFDFSKCLSAGGTLSLLPGHGTCYQQGDELVVEITLSEASELIGGGQFHLQYDTEVLDPAMVDEKWQTEAVEPFTEEVTKSINTATGHIDYAVGMPHDGTGTTEGVMARLYFTVKAEDICDATDVVAFRLGEDPPTRLAPASGFEPVDPALVDLPALAIDSTPPTISPPTGMPASADAGRCDALLVSLTDFESEPGEPPAYDFAMQLDGFVERTDPEALSGHYSIRITLSEPSDYARVRVVDPGIEGLTLGNCSGMFAAMVVPGSLPGQGPYMMFEVDANKNGKFDGVGLDALVIAAGTGIGTRPQGHWYTDGLNGGDQVHVVGDRTGLNPGEFVSGGTGLLSALRARTFDGETTWGDLPILGVRVGAGEWPNSTWFQCYVDDIIVAKALELPPAATDNCRTPLVTYTGLLTDPYKNGDTITWTATDACGNSATCEQTVTVEDRELPTIACPVDITVPTAPGACAAEVSLTLLPDDDWVLENDAEFVATDDGVALMLRNDGPSPYHASAAIWTPPEGLDLKFSDITTLAAHYAMTEGIISSGTPRFSIELDDGRYVFAYWASAPYYTATPELGEWQNTGNLIEAADARFELSGSYRTHAQILEAVGNQNVTAIYVVVDNSYPAPQAILVDSVTINETYAFGRAAIGTDNCDEVTVTATRSDGRELTEPFPVGTTTITWIAADDAGNQATCTQTVTVEDREPPVITCPPPDVPVECDASVDPLLPLTAGIGASATVEDGVARLYTADGGVGSAFVRLTIPGGIALEDIENLSYSAKVVELGESTWLPEVVLNIDADGDGLLEGTGVAWMTPAPSHDPAALGDDNFLAGDGIPVTETDADFVERDVLEHYRFWSADEDRAAGGAFYSSFDELETALSQQDYGIDMDDRVMSIDFVVGTSSNWKGSVIEIASVKLNDKEYKPSATGHATATDNCDPAPVISYTDGEPELLDQPTCPGHYSFVRTWTATDACGNSATCAQTITVEDTTPPTFTPPSHLTRKADAGGCELRLTADEIGWPSELADNCSAVHALQEKWERSDGAEDLTAPFTEPVTSITWTVTDECGNKDEYVQTITIEQRNIVEVDIELEGDLNPSGDALTRCITFKFYDCQGATEPAEERVEVNFSVQGGVGVADVDFEVDCGAYNFITAEDELHTLTSRVELGVQDGSYRADFTGDHKLIQGDLIDQYDGDGGWIDILDFAVYVNQWGWPWETGAGADTDCETPFPHADMNGDGAVDESDFSFITANFWKIGDAAPCDVLRTIGAGNLRGPRASITLAELHLLGLSDLVPADLNGDRVVDETDIMAFMSGATPKPKKPVPAASDKLQPEPAKAAPGLLDLIPAKLRR